MIFQRIQTENNPAASSSPCPVSLVEAIATPRAGLGRGRRPSSYPREPPRVFAVGEGCREPRQRVRRQLWAQDPCGGTGPARAAVWPPRPAPCAFGAAETPGRGRFRCLARSAKPAAAPRAWRGLEGAPGPLSRAGVAGSESSALRLPRPDNRPETLRAARPPRRSHVRPPPGPPCAPAPLPQGAWGARRGRAFPGLGLPAAPVVERRPPSQRCPAALRDAPGAKGRRSRGLPVAGPCGRRSGTSPARGAYT